MSAQPRGLGKGLSALISDSYPQRPSSAGAAEEGLQQLPIGKLVAGKYQPRSRFSPEELQELADSIAKNGIMQPIVARPSAQGSGKFEIVAGERRWRAAKQAGLARVPVIVRQMEDKQALELALVENIQRQDLSVLEEAQAYQRLMQEFSYTQEALAAAVGKSRSHVANLLRLLSLPESVKDLLHEGRLSMGHARALLTADDPESLAKRLVAEGLSVRQAEALRQKPPLPTRGGKPARGKRGGEKDADIAALEESLRQSLGLELRINDRGGQGEMTIAYESWAQLDEVLRRLGGSI